MGTIAKYVIVILFITTTVLANGLYQSIKSSGKIEQQLEEAYATGRSQETAIQAQLKHIQLLGEAYRSQIDEMDNAVKHANRGRARAESRASKAVSELDNVQSTPFDSPLDSAAIDGLSAAASTFMSTNTSTCSMQGSSSSTDGTNNLSRITPRVITEYSVRLAEKLEVCNNRLQAIQIYMSK